MSDASKLYGHNVDKLWDLIGKLRRGCDCEYDYRCGNCETIIEIKELKQQMDDEMARLTEQLKRDIENIRKINNNDT